ncbi:hypothetical protein NECAME_13735 [Necator americanus]|uniref:Uncharacterized protein n=1 Tax=Necator americanus TaxID=51031 RepID=W2ST57_NECAM|nr:hypothetical protein NECAME_13735 [Necator americanus]ETN72785.1 hypothetical protein NECAME_13735 [Necator americanus]
MTNIANLIEIGLNGGEFGFEFVFDRSKVVVDGSKIGNASIGLFEIDLSLSACTDSVVKGGDFGGQSTTLRPYKTSFELVVRCLAQALRILI